MSSQSSYNTVKYKCAWHRAKAIRSYILSSGESPDAQSRALSIALNHKEIASIMVVTGTILPEQYANVITQHEQKKNIVPCNICWKLTKTNRRKKHFCHIQYCFHCVISIKKTDQNEVNAFRDLLPYNRSSAYCQQKTASTKCGHLIAQVKNTLMKWSIKPCIVRTRKVSKSLTQEIVDWIMKISNVRQSPMTCDTLLIAYADSKVKRRVPKLLLGCSIRQLHNEIIDSPDYGGLPGT